MEKCLEININDFITQRRPSNSSYRPPKIFYRWNCYVCVCVCVWRMFCRCLFSPPLLGWLPFRVKSITQSDSLSAKNVCVMEFVGKRRSLSPLQLFRHFNDIAMGIRMGDVHLHNQTISIRCSLFFLLFFFFSIDRMAFIMFLKRLVCISKYDMVANTCNIKMYMLACQCRWSHHGFFPQHTHATVFSMNFHFAILHFLHITQHFFVSIIVVSKSVTFRAFIFLLFSLSLSPRHFWFLCAQFSLDVHFIFFCRMYLKSFPFCLPYTVVVLQPYKSFIIVMCVCL